MPNLSKERVLEFVNKVLAGNFLDAIDEYYDESVTVRENLGEVRVGRAHVLRHQQQVLLALKQMRTRNAHAVLIDGNSVAINWEFEMTRRDGTVHVLNEIAIQTWAGNRILHEQFFYDPRQLTSSPHQEM